MTVQSSVCVQAICRASPVAAVHLAFKVPFFGYNGLQDSFEGLWNMWLGIGRGIRDSSADWSGARGGLASPLEILSFLSQTR